MNDDFMRFKCKVAAKMKKDGLKLPDLVNKTGYSYSTLRLFMATGVSSRRSSPKVAKALAEALQIKL